MWVIQNKGSSATIATQLCHYGRILSAVSPKVSRRRETGLTNAPHSSLLFKAVQSY